MAGFFREHPGGYHTSAANIIAAFAFFKQHPDHLIMTGMWDTPTWSAAQFRRWFRHCLNEKINAHLPADMTTGRKHSDSYQCDLQHDGREINQYYGSRIRHAGTGWLRLREYQRRYPHVNRQGMDD